MRRIILGAIGALALSQSQARAEGEQAWCKNSNECYYPSTYCNWNNTGLPAEQQQVCAGRKKVAAEAAAKVQAKASPALLEYEKNMSKAAENFGHAYAASICQLRSERWYKTFNDAFPLLANDEAGRLKLSEQERNAALAVYEPVFNKSAAVQLTGANNTCDKIFNSAMMDKLDGIEKQLRGGYH